MKKLFLFISVLFFASMANAAVPTITVDGDKSEWAEVPMLSEPGAWPMLKVIPAADAEMGSNALVYMMENTEDFDPTWAKYPKVFIDKDYNGATHTIDAYWAFDAMGLEYSATTGVQVGDNWVSFPRAVSADNKVFEIGFPATYITDLESKFGFAMYYNSGAWFCPDRSEPAVNAFSPKNGFLYKTRSYATVDGTTHLTTANVYAHPSIGEVGEYVDFGLRDNGYDTIRWAAFPINLTQPAVYDVTTNVTTTNGWKFEFWLVDVATNAIVAHIDAPSSNISSSETSYTFGKLDLTSVPAGKYMLKVKNRTAYSTVKLNSIDLTYAGGAPVAIPGTLNIDDVILSNEAWVDKSGAVDSILFTARGSEGHNSVNYVKWKVNVTTAAWYNFKANVFRPDGSQRYEIKVLSNDENTELISNSLTGMPTGLASINSGNVFLEEGIYTIKIRNTYDYAKSRLLSVESEYIGGVVQAMPGTTNINDAWFSEEGTRADGKISFPESTIQDGWVKWNVSFASAATYRVNLTLNSGNSKHYTIALQDANGNDVVTPLDKSGGDKGTPATLEMGEMTVPAGNYILKVTNATQWSDAELISVQFVYEGGAVVTVPAEELVGNEAVLVNAGKLKVSKLANGDLLYGDNSEPLGEYVYWNIHATKGGKMNVTANVVAPGEGDPSGHQFLVELFSDLNEAALATTAESSQTDATGARALPAINIPAAGDYIVKLTNQTQWSSAILHSLEFEYVGGDLITLPAALNANDALFSDKAFADGGEIYFTPDAEHQNLFGQWAKWNVKVAAEGTFLFTLNVSSTNSQTYKMTILDGETEVDAYEEHPSSGSQTIKHYFNLAAGNYTVKVENTYSWSNGHVVSLAVTQPSLITIDEAAENNDILVANYYDGSKDIQINRTIVAGMYNTICLPFDVDNAQLPTIFGSDVELKQMNSAELAGDVLNLMFEDATSIYRGTPYLIKTSNDVVDPIFVNVIVKAKVAAQTSGTNADFIGNFIKSEVPAGENNLFLGPNDLLYFSETATPIKGMRAYFQVKGVSNPSQAIKHARIVMNGQVATDIELVNGQELKAKSQKLIENGQLVIIRDGIRYNAMGIVIK